MTHAPADWPPGTYWTPADIPWVPGDSHRNRRARAYRYLEQGLAIYVPIALWPALPADTMTALLG